MFSTGLHRVARHARRIALFASLVIALAPLYAFTATTANACACGCSVFDVGGGMLPQENDHGGRVWLEYWGSDQTQNWIGNSKGPASANTDKRLDTNWYSLGFMYMFNRDWGFMVRIPYGNRSFTTDTGPPAGIETFNVRAFADMEVMGIYTGFFKDMSTGIMYGLKLPTGTYTAPGMDRDSQLGTGSTDLLLGGFHRGLLTGDNAWQYFMQAMWRYPFLFQSAPDPQGFFDGTPGLVQTYKPGMQVDGAVGILYNNLYNVLGFDKITPLGQFIMSHRNHDTGDAADPLNSGFDRVMISPGIEFTKVIDEPNNRVLKTYFDVEVPIYYRTNAANNAGTEGQLMAPYLIKMAVSYNF
ncbi:MAG TPA: hypothetical protein VEK73_00285 [Xanthobacteraceae bacterium]|nr:hypothetical protein [Xanthobacteraceae bacterium]